MQTCVDARQCLSDVLAGASDTDTAAGLDAHLAACAPCRDFARDYCRLHRALCEQAAAESTTLVASVRDQLGARRRPRMVPARWLAAAVLLVAAGAVFWLTRPAAENPVARVERVVGEVYVVTGQNREPVRAGQPLQARQGLQTVGEDSGAVLVYADATRLEIGPDSTLADLRDSATGVGKRLALLSGSLDGDVTRQPADRPLVLTTPHAQLVARGTKFTLVNSPAATRVALEQGSARLTRRSDGQSVELEPGMFSVVSAEAEEALEPQPLAAQYTKPRANLPMTGLRMWAMTFAPDGRTLLTASSGGQVRLWDATRGAEQTPAVLCSDLSNEVRALAFSRDGRALAAGGDSPPMTRLWDWTTRQPLVALPGHRTWIEALAFDRDGKTLVVAGAHGEQSRQIHLWDVERRQTRTILDGHTGGVWCVAFSPDGNTLASAGRDGVIKLWDYAQGNVRKELTGHTSEVYAVAFSPDGRRLVSSSRDRTVKLWDVTTGRELHTLLGHSREVRAVVFAPDGRTIASGSQDCTVRLWRVTDGQELATFKLPGSAFAVAFAPDGRTLAAGGWYNSVQLWDLPAEPARGW